MYVNHLLIATIPQHKEKILAVLPSNAQIFYKNDDVYIEVKDIHWHPDFDPDTDNIINTVQSLPWGEWAFVRICAKASEVEVHGELELFGITVTTKAEY